MRENLRPEKPVTVDGETFLLDFDVYSGPLDALVELVRLKKIDVTQIPVLVIVEHFLDWIRTAVDAKLELAADWLLMAATLALLKSRILLPASKEEKAQTDMIVEDFMARLQRVQAIKSFADELSTRLRLGVHWHEPGDAEAASRPPSQRLDATLHTLLAAYVREARATLQPAKSPVRKPFLVFPVDDAIKLVEAFCREFAEWTSLLDILPVEPAVDVVHGRSRIASTYVASLELAKRGLVNVSQRGETVAIRARPRDLEIVASS